MRAPAKDVLDALTDPEVCSRWSPIGFEVEARARQRTVHRLTASVTVASGRSAIGRALEPATRALLPGGALQSAVARIARTVESPREAAALAS